ncbi:MAG: hypothetical protein ACI4LP_05345 [Anaerovoracaceae bacterium]
MWKIPTNYEMDEECDRVNGNCNKCKFSNWCENNKMDQEELLNSLEEW